jgi:hypothetical protein
MKREILVKRKAVISILKDAYLLKGEEDYLYNIVLSGGKMYVETTGVFHGIIEESRIFNENSILDTNTPDVCDVCISLWDIKEVINELERMQGEYLKIVIHGEVATFSDDN